MSKEAKAFCLQRTACLKDARWGQLKSRKEWKGRACARQKGCVHIKGCACLVVIRICMHKHACRLKQSALQYQPDMCGACWSMLVRLCRDGWGSARRRKEKDGAVQDWGSAGRGMSAH
eukprot:1159269-Pelagomonas_calceolata.AAC.12